MPLNWAIESSGRGPDIVLIHGWASHSAVWQEWINPLRDRYRFHAVDLPGFGATPAADDLYRDVTALSEALLEHLPRNACWCGWSMGGLIALQAACLAPERVNSLILIAVTPRFRAAGQWPHGIAADQFTAFQRRLTQQPLQAVAMFHKLQFLHDTAPTRAIRRFTATCRRHGTPATATLLASLDMLQGCDLRPHIAAIRQPVLIMQGERDAIVPPSTTAYWRQQLPHAAITMYPAAGHVPFLTQPMPVLHRTSMFLTDCHES